MGRCLISFLVAAGVTVLGRKKGGVQRGRPRLVGHLAQAFVRTSSYSMCVKL